MVCLAVESSLAVPLNDQNQRSPCCNRRWMALLILCSSIVLGFTSAGIFQTQFTGNPDTQFADPEPGVGRVDKLQIDVELCLW